MAKIAVNLRTPPPRQSMARVDSMRVLSRRATAGHVGSCAHAALGTAASKKNTLRVRHRSCDVGTFRTAARFERRRDDTGIVALGSPGQCSSAGTAWRRRSVLSFHFAADYFDEIGAAVAPQSAASFRTPKLSGPGAFPDRRGCVRGACRFIRCRLGRVGIRLAARRSMDDESPVGSDAASPAAVAVSRSVRSSKSSPPRISRWCAWRVRPVSAHSLPANLRKGHRNDAAPICCARAASGRHG